MREQDKRVGVLAVDPSSPFSGGALLGDRVRMQDHALDKDVYIRSMASRGHLGGLSWATPQALRVLEAAGCDVILIETVGVGQSEVEIAAMADTTMVLIAPGMGDGIQAAKAGILEIGDVYVINKADRDGADQVRRELRSMIGAGRATRGRLEARDRQDRRQQGRGHRRRGGRDRQAPRVARRPPASCRSAGCVVPATRSRRSPSPPCASSGAACTRTPRWTSSPAEVVAGESDPYAAADLLLESLESGAASGVTA